MTDYIRASGDSLPYSVELRRATNLVRRKPADKPTEFVPDMLKILRAQELSIAQLTVELEQDFSPRVRRWADALSGQGLLRHRKIRDARNRPMSVYTLAKAWGGEVDK